MTRYLLQKKLQKAELFPLVLMLEPTHRCNLTCAGCGRIREYRDTILDEMTLSECLKAVDEADAPVVTITGGEPLLYSRVTELGRRRARARKAYLFLYEWSASGRIAGAIPAGFSLHLEHPFRRFRGGP